MSTLLWLRRDLRVHDHPALHAARRDADGLVPVFCLDDRLLHGRHASGPRTTFLLECLRDLERALASRGSGLVVRRGPPERELARLARDTGATALHFTADVGPFARSRDRAVTAALEGSGIEVTAHPGLFVVDAPDAIRTANGDPYSVFSPYHRAWLRSERRALVAAPRTLPPLPRGVDTGRLPTLEELDLRSGVHGAPGGGETAARKAMHAFLRDRVHRYDDGRDALAGDEVSRLSPHLHFGCLSARELEDGLPGDAGGLAYRRQLCWRDFYAQVLAAWPDNARQEHQERYRGTLSWSGSEERFRAWAEGRTGYPVVDAAMRQLAREGWMHNRARLIVGSFLTKDLAVDWRRGERHFMNLLVDGDEASNNGNWQWIASVGVDPQPPFRRMYNPTRQQARFDPTGAFVRRYVPELGSVPDEYLAEPWTMPPLLQEEVGCVIGRDYPEPIVDHGMARREALERYANAR